MSDGWTYAPPTEPWLEVVHEDKDLCVIDKPSGLLSVPGRDPAHADSAYARVLERHPLAQVVHRLDMDTSGLLLFALRRKAERALQAQFRERRVAKRYEARVWGHPSVDHGVIDLALSRVPGRPRSVLDPGGRPAQTAWQVLCRDPDGTARLSLEPKTGRSHQLRVHLLALGHPILGDRFYAPAEALAAAPRLCLHAAALEVDHPWSGERLAFGCETPF